MLLSRVAVLRGSASHAIHHSRFDTLVVLLSHAAKMVGSNPAGLEAWRFGSWRPIGWEKHILLIEDPEIKPSMFVLMKEGPEIILRNINSYETGS